MAQIFVYISTRTTADPFIPSMTPSLPIFSRDVSDAFVALSGGYQRVGQLVLFPLQRSVPSHLLCDGREVPKADFPELYAFLGDTQGAAVDAANFVLPNFVAGELVPAASAEPETASQGTVATPTPVGGSDDYYGDADSGGRIEFDPSWLGF